MTVDQDRQCWSDQIGRGLWPCNIPSLRHPLHLKASLLGRRLCAFQGFQANQFSISAFHTAKFQDQMLSREISEKINANRKNFHWKQRHVLAWLHEYLKILPAWNNLLCRCWPADSFSNLAFQTWTFHLMNWILKWSRWMAFLFLKTFLTIAHSIS